MRSGIAGVVVAALSIGTLIQGLAATAPPAAAAEFQINTFTPGFQSAAKVARLAGGGFVVVWASFEQDGSGYGVYGRRYTAAGAAVGDEFPINTHTDSDQIEPAVAALPNGGFVVVWTSRYQDDTTTGQGYGVFAQRFNAKGVKAGKEFQVNVHWVAIQHAAAIIALPDDGFFITWSSQYQDDSVSSDYGIYGRRFDAKGVALGKEFRVNKYTVSDQRESAIARLEDGSVVVVWSSIEQDGSARGVFGRLYNAHLKSIGDEFPVNRTTEGSQGDPAVAALHGGGFVVVWASERESAEIRGQRFSSDGTKEGPEFQANGFTTNDQNTPQVVVTDEGNFIVVWTSYLQDGSEHGVYGRRYNPEGKRIGEEFPINQTIKNSQSSPAIAPWKAKGFVVVWRSGNADGTDAEVVGRLFK